MRAPHFLTVDMDLFDTSKFIRENENRESSWAAFYISYFFFPLALPRQLHQCNYGSYDLQIAGLFWLRRHCYLFAPLSLEICPLLNLCRAITIHVLPS